jgi:hypothetical protein
MSPPQALALVLSKFIKCGIDDKNEDMHLCVRVQFVYSLLDNEGEKCMDRFFLLCVMSGQAGFF